MSTASDYGSYDLLTFVTGCSRQRVHLLPPIYLQFVRVPVTSLSQAVRDGLKAGRKPAYADFQVQSRYSIAIIAFFLITARRGSVNSVLRANYR